MTHHNKPFNKLYRKATPEDASPNETAYDSNFEHPDNSFYIFQDQDDNISMYSSENQENVAPKEQELTMTFALSPKRSVSVFKGVIYPGYR
ncbi:hypothetical protein QBC46DRAFT_352339 [Diplogelasinospora grovesii]|uniref:Uncharacterized protein n=1 Tax=Diplogelasinospora grovesii TaxID=303347 RepID=A0AAN6NAV1_9PEZI|nr:hypothetical protein QBC46DRAFT_352339 [Diplogelasinospora grovesii]